MDVLYAKGWSFNLIGSAPSQEEKAPEMATATAPNGCQVTDITSHQVHCGTMMSTSLFGITVQQNHLRIHIRAVPAQQPGSRFYADCK